MNPDEEKLKRVVAEYAAQRDQSSEVLETVHTQLGPAAHDSIKVYLETCELLETFGLLLSSVGMPKAAFSIFAARAVDVQNNLAHIAMLASMYDTDKLDADEERMDAVAKFIKTLAQRNVDARLKVIKEFRK